MASSSYYQAEINSCFAQIQACQQQLAQEQEKLSNNEFVYDNFRTEKAAYIEQIQARRARSKNIENLSSKSKFANKYARNSKDLFFGNKYATNMRNLDDLDSSLKSSVLATENRVQELQTSLRNLETNISTLTSQYHDALRREEEERQAAAAALISGRN